METETSDYLYSTEASVGEGRRAVGGDVVRRSDDEYSEGHMRHDRGAAPDVSDADGGRQGRWGQGDAEEEEGPVKLDEFMALLREKGVLGGVVTESEALEAFRRHATRPGTRDSNRQLGVAGCKRAVKELLESKDMLSRCTIAAAKGRREAAAKREDSSDSSQERTARSSAMPPSSRAGRISAKQHPSSRASILPCPHPPVPPSTPILPCPHPIHPSTPIPSTPILPCPNPHVPPSSPMLPCPHPSLSPAHAWLASPQSIRTLALHVRVRRPPHDETPMTRPP